MRYTMILALFLSGCTTAGLTAGIVVDELRDTAEYTLCQSITVGSWHRAYGRDVKRADAWGVLCDKYLK